MDITIYNLKLTEIDREISEKRKAIKAVDDKFAKCIEDWYNCGMMCINPAIDCGRKVPRNTSYYLGLKRAIPLLQKKRETLIEEMVKEQQFLKDQEFLQQQQATEAAKAAVAKALAEVSAAKNKSEQEKQKAAQELARANAAKRLADKGDPQSSRILLGLEDPKDYKKPLIIGGIVLVASGIGFGIYKLIK